MGTKLKLSDLHTSVVIPSYELESSSPFTFWHKHSASTQESQTGYVAMLRADDMAGLDATSMVGGVQFVKGRDFKLWEVARASSAAPTYFPGKLGSSAGAVDMRKGKERKGRKGKERKEKTTPFGANLMRSQALYWAAQLLT